MADARTFYVNPSVIINQNAQQNVDGGMNVQNIQGNIQNAEGTTILNTGDLIADVNGVAPGDANYITTTAPPVFQGASNRLNILNNTTNGPVPLSALGRLNYNVVTVTDDAFDALEMAGTIDANTLYLIRESI